MIVRQRMLSAQIAEKNRCNKELLKQLGIEVTYTDNDYLKGETKNEKNDDRRKNATCRYPDLKRNNVY